MSRHRPHVIGALCAIAILATVPQVAGVPIDACSLVSREGPPTTAACAFASSKHHSAGYSSRDNDPRPPFSPCIGSAEPVRNVYGSYDDDGNGNFRLTYVAQDTCGTNVHQCDARIRETYPDGSRKALGACDDGSTAVVTIWENFVDANGFRNVHYRLTVLEPIVQTLDGAFQSNTDRLIMYMYGVWPEGS